MRIYRSERSSRSGFSLIELMVAMTILTVLMLTMTSLLEQVQRSWQYSESRVSQFREARVAFDLMTKNISQASLNTYWDLEDQDEDGLFDGYFRTSELHFITMESQRLGTIGAQEPVGHAIFFQAPLGFSTNYRNLNNLFNGRGYFAAFGSDAAYRPSFINARDRFRFRLMEFRPPAESNQIFEDGREEREAGEPQEFTSWFRQAMGIGEGNFESHLNPLADNIIALIISPRETLENAADTRGQTFSQIAPNYTFDSNDGGAGFEEYEQQVPPLVRVTMVAIDEASAVRLDEGNPVMPQVLRAALAGRFQRTEAYQRDVETLSQELNQQQVNHKVFSSLVMLRSSRWSS